jgi:hypothetical protein
MTSTAIEHAATLLQQRRSEAMAEIEGLRNEVKEIEGALVSLGFASTLGAHPSEGLARKSVRAAVLALLESAPRQFSAAEIASAISAQLPDRPEDQLKSTIRTAVWTLRKHNQIVTVQGGRHLATKWLPVLNVDQAWDEAAREARAREEDEDADAANETDEPPF